MEDDGIKNKAIQKNTVQREIAIRKRRCTTTAKNSESKKNWAYRGVTPTRNYRPFPYFFHEKIPLDFFILIADYK